MAAPRDPRAEALALRSALEPGDILLTLSNSVSGLTLARASGGEHSHAALWSGTCVLESTFPAVKQTPLLDFIRGRVHVDIYRYNAESRERRAIAAANAESFLNYPYCELDLVWAIAVGTITAWLQTDWPRVSPHADWLRFNTLYSAGKLRASLERVRRQWHEALRSRMNCVDLVVRAHIQADLPVRIKLNPRGKLNVHDLRRSVSQLMDARSKAQREASYEEQSTTPNAGNESDGSAEFEREALEASLDWLEALVAEMEKHALDEQALEGLEMSVDEIKGLTFTAGLDWPGGLVTPLQLAESPDLKLRHHVALEEPIGNCRTTSATTL